MKPDADQLFGAAVQQGGLFTTAQAAAAGYSPQLIAHHLGGGRSQRVRRGIYRLAHFPFVDDEDLIVAWLWSDQAGVLSHDTALALHRLSDILPARIHLTLPASWKKRRLRVPPGVVVHIPDDDVGGSERSWFGAVPITTVARTLRDCSRHGLTPDLLRQASREALERGLVARGDLVDVERALAPYGGVGP
jgi:predicted transcriptional regulator of viral defense system